MEETMTLRKEKANKVDSKDMAIPYSRDIPKISDIPIKGHALWWNTGG